MFNLESKMSWNISPKNVLEHFIYGCECAQKSSFSGDWSSS